MQHIKDDVLLQYTLCHGHSVVCLYQPLLVDRTEERQQTGLQSLHQTPGPLLYALSSERHSSVYPVIYVDSDIYRIFYTTEGYLLPRTVLWPPTFQYRYVFPHHLLRSPDNREQEYKQNPNKSYPSF